MMPIVRILAISGSLRIASLNSALLQAVSCLAPSDVRVELFTELGNLPPFNPDIEISDLPPVANFHARLLEADGVPYEVAKEALRLGAQKLPITTKFIVRRDYIKE